MNLEEIKKVPKFVELLEKLSCIQDQVLTLRKQKQEITQELLIQESSLERELNDSFPSGNCPECNSKNWPLWLVVKYKMSEELLCTNIASCSKAYIGMGG